MAQRGWRAYCRLASWLSSFCKAADSRLILSLTACMAIGHERQLLHVHLAPQLRAEGVPVLHEVKHRLKVPLLLRAQQPALPLEI